MERRAWPAAPLNPLARLRSQSVRKLRRCQGAACGADQEGAAGLAGRSAKPAGAITQPVGPKASPLENFAACASAVPQTLVPPFVAALHENAYSWSARGVHLIIPRSGPPIR